MTSVNIVLFTSDKRESEAIISSHQTHQNKGVKDYLHSFHFCCL